MGSLFSYPEDPQLVIDRARMEQVRITTRIDPPDEFRHFIGWNYTMNIRIPNMTSDMEDICEIIVEFPNLLFFNSQYMPKSGRAKCEWLGPTDSKTFPFTDGSSQALKEYLAEQIYKIVVEKSKNPTPLFLWTEERANYPEVEKLFPNMTYFWQQLFIQVRAILLQIVANYS